MLLCGQVSSFGKNEIRWQGSRFTAFEFLKKTEYRIKFPLRLMNITFSLILSRKNRGPEGTWFIMYYPYEKDNKIKYEHTYFKRILTCIAFYQENMVWLAFSWKWFKWRIHKKTELSNRFCNTIHMKPSEVDSGPKGN